MKLIETKNAVGCVLCHDITQIIRGVTKDVRFRKGHVVTEDDIPVLLSLGKEHLYIWEKQEGMLHENEAAKLLCRMCEGKNMTRGELKEGKLELFAACDGVFKADPHRLFKINALDEIMIATRHNNTPVKKGDKLAGTRVIPLVISEEKLAQAQELAGDKPLLSLLPYSAKKAGIVTTGSEVLSGRIKDTFSPVVAEKLAEYGTVVIGQRLCGDDPADIKNSIMEIIAEGAELVICTGGMSVDPDDRTPAAIKATGAEVISYGAPVLPGAMFMLAYYGSTPIMGLPGCVMYAKRTIFDLVLPRVMADDRITKNELAALGHGGLCLNCNVCAYPNCGFGK